MTLLAHFLAHLFGSIGIDIPLNLIKLLFSTALLQIFTFDSLDLISPKNSLFIR